MSDEVNGPSGLGQVKHHLSQGAGLFYLKDRSWLWAVMLHLCLLWAIIFLAMYVLNQLLPLPQCVWDCEREFANNCCRMHHSVLVRWVVGLAAVFFGSYEANRWVTRYRLIHSSCVTAFLILSLVFANLFLGIAWWFVGLVLVSVFLGMFYGYRLAIWENRRNSAPS